MNIGIFSGSFNPIHKGHTELAMYICEHCRLDEVWLMVSPNNPLKEKSDLWDEQFRLQLARLATQNIPNIMASDFEFRLPRPSYTVNTLKVLTKEYPQHSFSFIIGSDNLQIFHLWKDHQYILDHFPLIVYPRQGDDLQALHRRYPQIKIVDDAPLLSISSTMIRERIANKESIAGMVDDEVRKILE